MQFETPSRARCTFSEVQWIFDQHNLEDTTRIKAEQARRRTLQPYMTEGVFSGIPELPSDAERSGKSFQRFVLDLKIMTIIAAIGRDAQGNELHLVELELADNDLGQIYDLAKDQRDRREEWAENFNTRMALEHAVEDTVYPEPEFDEDAVADVGAMLFQQGLRNIQVASGIVHAYEEMQRKFL